MKILHKIQQLRFAIWMLFMVSAALSCDRCLHKSKVASNARANINGACGYGTSATSLTTRGGLVTASASAKIYREGVGCGACYQIRCTDPGVCTKPGVKVLVTDFTKNTQTDFVLSARSFSRLAVPSKAAQFLKMGTVDVDYKRIPCEYGGQNMTVKVDKSSKYPDYLAVQFLYQGGQTDITAVEVDQVGSSGWQYMTRNQGAIWGMQNPPRGYLSFRLLVTGGYDGSWVWPRRNLLPSIWTPGSVYESGIQITEIAQEGCSPCETGNWTDTYVN